MSYISFCNFNSKSDGRRYDFFSTSESRAKTPLSDSYEYSSTPGEVSAIPCVLFGNTLRALFLQSRDFFCYGEIFLPNTQGPLGCLLGFWPSGPKPGGGAIKVKSYFGEGRFNFPRTIIKVKPEFGGRINILGSVR